MIIYREIIKSKEYLKKGKIEEALSQCEKIVKSLKEKSYEIDLINIMAQYNLNKKDMNLGVKTIGEDSKYNRIINSIVILLNDIETNQINSEEGIERGNEWEMNNSSFHKAMEARKSFDLNYLLPSSNQLEMIGYTCVNVIDVIKANLEDAILKNNLKFRLILIKQNSNTSDLLNSHTRTSPMNSDLERVLKKIEYIKQNILEEDPSKVNNIEIKMTNWVPSCNLMIVNGESNNGIMQVAINPIFHGTPRGKFSAHQVIEKSKEDYWFNLFYNQFENLWNFPDSSEPNFKQEVRFKQIK